MPTKTGTKHIGLKGAENAFHAVRYAADQGRPINTMVTVNFTSLGIDDDAGRIFADLQARLVRWWRDQRTRKGRDIGALAGIHSHANPAGSRHVHWMTHIPDEMTDDFTRAVGRLLRKLIGRYDLGEGLHICPVRRPGTLAKYILRGIDPAYADYFHIRPANEGLIEDCRVSKSIGRSARKRAGWKRRRRPRG